MTEFGYAGEILKINLTDRIVSTLPTADYTAKFLGGRGLAAKLFWDMVPPDAGALKPENCLVFVNGPFAGFNKIAGSRYQICGKSPESQPEAFSYCNLGGKWGIDLKLAGYDAVAMDGKADKPVYLFIHNGGIEIRDAAFIWGKSTFDAIDAIKEQLGQQVSVLTIGPAGENMVTFATILGEGNASGGGGLGSVMGSKKLKAIAVTGNKAPKAAYSAKLQNLIDQIKEARGPITSGGRNSPFAVPGVTSIKACYGCDAVCGRQMYAGENGREYKSFCQATNVYKKPVLDYFGQYNEAQLLAIRLCDGYGLDTSVMEALIAWLIECCRENVLTTEMTGLPLLKAGSAEFIEALTRKISFREGFGDLLAQGVMYAAEKIGYRARELTTEFVSTRTNECKDYDPRMFITTAIFYATEPRRPIHQLHGVSHLIMMWLPFARGNKNIVSITDDLRAFATRSWGSEIAADFSTYEGKALAAKKIQDRAYAKESLIVCDLAWRSSPARAPALESQIFSAITGREMDEAELCQAGERVFNLQRAIQLRFGWGGRKGDRLLDHLHSEPLKRGSIFYNPDALMPGPNGEVISKVGVVVDRKAFDELMTEYYQLRGWNGSTGFPKEQTLKRLGLDDVAVDLKIRGFLG